MIFQAAWMEQEGLIECPRHVHLVMGIRNAMPVDREVFEICVRTLRRLSPRHLDRRRHRARPDDLGSIVLGTRGHSCIVMEDKVRLDRETLALSNAALAIVIRPFAPRPARHRAPRSVDTR